MCGYIHLTWYFAMSLLFQCVCGTSWIDSLRLCVLSLKFRVFGSSRSFPPIWVSIWRTSYTKPQKNTITASDFLHKFASAEPFLFFLSFFSYSTGDCRKPLIYLHYYCRQCRLWCCLEVHGNMKHLKVFIEISSKKNQWLYSLDLSKAWAIEQTALNCRETLRCSVKTLMNNAAPAKVLLLWDVGNEAYL